MNVTKNLQYSKATRGLKQSEAIQDSQFRLVFVYPMLFDNNVSNIRVSSYADDQNNLQDLLRAYISVTIFVWLLKT